MGMLLANEQAGIHGKHKQYDSHSLEQKIDKFVRETGRQMDLVVLDVAKMVCESAGKITPPGDKYIISSDKFTRPILTMTAQGGTRQGGKAKSAVDESAIGYIVKINATDKKEKIKIYFKDCASRADALEKAKGYQTVFNRGVAKAGWWLAILKLKGSAPASKFGYDVPSHFSQISAVQDKPASWPSSRVITVINSVTSIDRFGEIALRHGLRSARIRLSHQLNDLKAKVKASA